MRLPEDPRDIARRLPDDPWWVEARALLLSGDAVVHRSASATGAVALDPALPSGFLVGHADADLLRNALTGVADGFELVVQAGAADDARAALPGWTTAAVTVFSLPEPWSADRAPEPDVVISAPPEERWLALVPEADKVRFYCAIAEAMAVRLVDGAVVAVCAAGDVTETLWDVGVDTVDAHRRHGHAAAAFRGLATHMAAAGRQPVWCAEDENLASMALATRLGFEPVGRLAILTPQSA